MSRFAALQDNSGPFVIQTDTGDTIHAVLQNRQGEFFPLPQYELDSNKQIVQSLQILFTTAPPSWDECNPGTPFIPNPLLTVKTPDWDDAVNGTFQEQERKSMQPKPFTVAVSSNDFRKLICRIDTGSAIINYVLNRNILSTEDAIQHVTDRVKMINELKHQLKKKLNPTDSTQKGTYDALQAYNVCTKILTELKSALLNCHLYNIKEVLDIALKHPDGEAIHLPHEASNNAFNDPQFQEEISTKILGDNDIYDHPDHRFELHEDHINGIKAVYAIENNQLYYITRDLVPESMMKPLEFDCKDLAETQDGVKLIQKLLARYHNLTRINVADTRVKLTEFVIPTDKSPQAALTAFQKMGDSIQQAFPYEYNDQNLKSILLEALPSYYYSLKEKFAIVSVEDFNKLSLVDFTNDIKRFWETTNHYKSKTPQKPKGSKSNNTTNGNHNGSSQSKNKPLTCTYCKKGGHTANKCWNNPKSENFQQNKKRSNPENKKTNSDGKACVNCGGTNHLSSQCHRLPENKEAFEEWKKANPQNDPKRQKTAPSTKPTVNNVVDIECCCIIRKYFRK